MEGKDSGFFFFLLNADRWGVKNDYNIRFINVP